MKNKLLFISAYNSSFVRNDLEILKKHYIVKVPDLVGKKNNLYDLWYSFFSILWGVLRSDIVLCWFADFKAYLAISAANLFDKRSFVIVGGYEVANLPEINYGGLLNKGNLKRLKYTLSKATKVFAVSEFSKTEITDLISSTDIKVLYHGLDLRENKLQKENLVVTIGNATEDTYKLKGLETYIKTSQQFPEYRFIIIGKYDDDIKQKTLQMNSNITFTGQIPQDEAYEWLKKAKVYCQLSLRESFGVALLEAMNFECIPVVTNRGALPEVVGETGFIVSYDDVEETVNAIRFAIHSDNGSEARKRVKDNFSLQKRELLLIKEMKGTDET
ncbi:MAG: glycosyltransferase [Candidatus Cloacimonetes bacterium]|nr:glycosyltransferase [Candidatus Cloacimonadota bacterium]